MFFQTPSLLLFLVKGKAILFKIYVQDNLRQGRINLSIICDSVVNLPTICDSVVNLSTICDSVVNLSTICDSVVNLSTVCDSVVKTQLFSY